MTEIGSLVTCRGETWAVTEHTASPHGFPPYLRISRIDERGLATSLVVGDASVEVIGLPIFVQGDDVSFGLDSRGSVLTDDGGQFITVVSDFPRHYRGGSKFKVSREVPVTRAELVRGNTGLASKRIGV
jgi:hypothetical protein